MNIDILLGIGFGIGILLLLILVLRIPSFISLLLASIVVGLSTGLSPYQMMQTIEEGMGSTLGFVATVIGLGTILGAILEHSGGTLIISRYLVKIFGEKNAPTAMLVTGFIVAIPVFFDIAFIILTPILYALQRQSKKSLLSFAIPLLAGLAVTHAFVPPTPGPVAVADILDVDLGAMMLIGLVVGLPSAIVSGLVFGKYIANNLHVDTLDVPIVNAKELRSSPLFSHVMLIIVVPILLILTRTILIEFGVSNEIGTLGYVLDMLGHPFGALLIANLMAWYVLGIKKGMPSKELFQVCSSSLESSGAIILLTGAGGVFKQVLITTGGGEAIATSLVETDIPVIFFVYISAVLIRVIQGSSTVAMVTTAGLTAPIVEGLGLSNIKLAIIAVAIASGSSMLSHVNDSGFWLVKQYLGLTEKETFKSWSTMTVILSLSGFICALILYLLFN